MNKDDFTMNEKDFTPNPAISPHEQEYVFTIFKNLFAHEQDVEVVDYNITMTPNIEDNTTQVTISAIIKPE